MMGGAASLERDHHRRQFLEELDHLAAAQLLAKHRLFCGIDAVQLKKAL